MSHTKKLPLLSDEKFTGFYDITNEGFFLSNFDGKFFIIDHKDSVTAKMAKEVINCSDHSNGKILDFGTVFLPYC